MLLTLQLVHINVQHAEVIVQLVQTAQPVFYAIMENMFIMEIVILFALRKCMHIKDLANSVLILAIIVVIHIHVQLVSTVHIY